MNNAAVPSVRDEVAHDMASSIADVSAERLSTVVRVLICGLPQGVDRRWSPPEVTT